MMTLISMPRSGPGRTHFRLSGTPTTRTNTLSLHDALPILPPEPGAEQEDSTSRQRTIVVRMGTSWCARAYRSEEHTSELQSQFHLVCRLLLEKKNRHDRIGHAGAVLAREKPRQALWRALSE